MGGHVRRLLGPSFSMVVSSKRWLRPLDATLFLTPTCLAQVAMFYLLLVSWTTSTARYFRF